MALTLPAFRNQLGAATLNPVYLLAGAEHLLVLEAADALRARARELGYSEREAVAAVRQLPDGVAVADGIKQALKLLAKA